MRYDECQQPIQSLRRPFSHQHCSKMDKSLCHRGYRPLSRNGTTDGCIAIAWSCCLRTSPVLDRFDVKRYLGTGHTELLLLSGSCHAKRHRTGVRVTVANSRSLGNPFKLTNAGQIIRWDYNLPIALLQVLGCGRCVLGESAFTTVNDLTCRCCEAWWLFWLDWVTTWFDFSHLWWYSRRLIVYSIWTTSTDTQDGYCHLIHAMYVPI